MIKGLFDNYNIRARLCACIFILSPLLINAYILIEELRTLSATLIVLITTIAVSCFLITWVRYCGSKYSQTDYIALLLHPNSDEIDKITKIRYYEKLHSLHEQFDFSTITDEREKQTTDKLLISVSSWLKSKTRSDKYYLVREENCNYGFIRNIYVAKKTFLIIFSIITVLFVAWLYIKSPSTTIAEFILTLPGIYLACLIIHAVTFIIWIGCITPKLVEFVARKYAMAVLSAVDEL